MLEKPKEWEELFRVEVPFSKEFGKAGAEPMLKIPGVDAVLLMSRGFWEVIIRIFEDEAKKKCYSEGERAKISEVSETIRMGLKRREEG